MRINRLALLEALQSIAPGLGKEEHTWAEGKVTSVRSDCFVFDAGWIYTFNGAVYARIPFAFPEPITGAVHAASLLRTLRRLRQPTLEAEIAKGRWIFRVGEERIGFRLHEPSLAEHINAARITQPGTWKPIPEGFAKLARIITRRADNLCCVDAPVVRLAPNLLESHGQTSACRWRVTTGLEKSVLLPRKTIMAIVATSPTHWVDSPHRLHVRTAAGSCLSCRLQDGKCCDLDKAFNSTGVLRLLLPKRLLQELQRIRIFTKNCYPDEGLLSLEIGDNVFALYGRGVNGFYEYYEEIEHVEPRFDFIIAEDDLTTLIKHFPNCSINADTIKAKKGQVEYIMCNLSGTL
jgi:hypothetical protein